MLILSFSCFPLSLSGCPFDSRTQNFAHFNTTSFTVMPIICCCVSSLILKDKEQTDQSGRNITSMKQDLTLEYLEQITKQNILTKDDCENACVLLVEADQRYQLENGNMDSILRLWKCYLPLLKKSSLVKREIAARLFDTLDTYVSQGLQSLITSSSTSSLSSQTNQQMTVKLQLLNFFLQRLCATIIYFLPHLSLETHISSCFLHLYCFQGYLLSQSSFIESYEPKIRELYLKFLDPTFVSLLGTTEDGGGLRRLLFSVSLKLASHSITGSTGLTILIGALHCVTIDLQSMQTATALHLRSPLVVNSYLDIYLTSIALLSSHYCGLMPDVTVSHYVKKLGQLLTNILLETNRSSELILVSSLILLPSSFSSLDLLLRVICSPAAFVSRHLLRAHSQSQMFKSSLRSLGLGRVFWYAPSMPLAPCSKNQLS
jgi:hypothetical protein